jgi:hypothetical protein
MNNWMLLILQWGPSITQIVLLVLQIHAYRRTSHYSLALLAVAGTAGLLAFGLVWLLSLEALYPRLRTGVFDAMVLSYTAYMVLGIWGAAALFRSYSRLTQDSNVLSHPSAD